MNLTEMLPAIFTGFGAIGGVAGISALLRLGIDRRKGKAEAGQAEAAGAKILSDTAVGLLDPFREQIGFLRTELQAARVDGVAAREESRAAREESEKLRGEVHQLREFIGDLIAALTITGVEAPPWPAALAAVRDLPTEQPRESQRRRRGDRAGG